MSASIIIERVDVENLRNYTILNTNVISIDDVTKIFKKSKFKDIELFEQTNKLYKHSTEYYIQIINNISMIELTNLFVKIPWKVLCDDESNTFNKNELIELLNKVDANEENKKYREVLNNIEIANRIVYLCCHVGLWHINNIDLIKIDPIMIEQYNILLDMVSQNVAMAESHESMMDKNDSQ